VAVEVATITTPMAMVVAAVVSGVARRAAATVAVEAD
jgi:hypothetical protein